MSAKETTEYDPNEGLTDSQIKFLEVFEAQACHISNACKAANISRQTFYHWSDNSDVFKEKVKAAKEALIDTVEGYLLKNISGGNVVAQIFFLKTKAKDRGYVEKTEVEHSGSTVSHIESEYVSPDD